MKLKGTHGARTIAMCAAAILLLIATSCYNIGKVNFDGSRVKDVNLFTVKSSMMNTSESHSIMMEAGDDFLVDFDVESGRMDVLIKAPSGATGYKGNEIETASFKVTAKETGLYEIVLDAKRFKGSVSFSRIRNNRNSTDIDSSADVQ